MAQRADGFSAAMSNVSASGSMRKDHTHEVHDKLIAVRSACVAETMNAAHRSKMEDASVLEDQFNGDGNGLFCVFDGHGGRQVVDFVEQRFAKVLQEELNFDKSRSVEDCLTSAYIITDIQSRQANLMQSGCTSITCLMLKAADGKRQMYSANAGDARAVICQGGKATRLSQDHKASDTVEKKRIEELGGFVMRDRVLGMLAVSRAFGDHTLKQFVSARPYISKMTLTGDEEFLIVACDGLWDELSDEEAVKLVRDNFYKNGSEMKAADALVQRALEKGTKDNVTVMVVFF